MKALVGPPPGAAALVAIAVGAGGERLPAQATAVGALAGVGLPVPVQPRPGRAGLPALAAPCGLSPARTRWCRTTLWLRLKLPALPARARPVCDVHPPEPDEGAQHAEGPPALAALVGPLPGAEALVQDKRVLGLKAFPRSAHVKGLMPV